MAWLMYEGKNPRLDISKWTAAGMILGGIAGIVWIALKASVF